MCVADAISRFCSFSGAIVVERAAALLRRRQPDSLDECHP